MNYYQQLVSFIQKNERLFFWLYALLHFFLIWAFEWFMTFDGPSHLYNAHQLWEILSGNGETLLNWYSLNPRPDNWLVHGLLAIFSVMAGPAIGEKLLLTLYALVFVWGFRAWMVQNGYRAMSWWIFFLVYSTNFYLGQYSYVISVALVPWFMVAWQKWLIEGGNKRLFWSGLLLTLIYLTHLVSFAVTGLVAGIFALVVGVNWTSRIRILRYLLLISLPGLALFVWFFYHNPLSTNLSFMSLTDKLDGLFRIRSLTVFSLTKESEVTIPLFISMVLIFGWLIYDDRFKSKSVKANVGAVLALFVVYLLAPDVAAGGGYIVMRLNLLLMLFLMASLALTKPFSGRWNWIWAFVVIGQLVLLNRKLQASNSLSDDVKEFQESQAFMHKNATLVAFNYSPNWFHQHITEYPGLEVPLINFTNYEASNAYFPLGWRKDEHVKACIRQWGASLTFPQQPLQSVPDSSILPDQILLWCKNTLSEDQNDTLLNDLLAQQYQLVHASEGGRLEVYLHRRIKKLPSHEH